MKIKIKSINPKIIDFFDKYYKRWICIALTTFMISPPPVVAKTKDTIKKLKPLIKVEQRVTTKDLANTYFDNRVTIDSSTGTQYVEIDMEDLKSSLDKLKYIILNQIYNCDESVFEEEDIIITYKSAWKKNDNYRVTDENSNREYSRTVIKFKPKNSIMWKLLHGNESDYDTLLKEISSLESLVTMDNAIEVLDKQEETIIVISEDGENIFRENNPYTMHVEGIDLDIKYQKEETNVSFNELMGPIAFICSAGIIAKLNGIMNKKSDEGKSKK